jgi:hypothetical protein
MTTFLNTKETIRLALLYAIDDRTSYLHSLGDYNEDGVKERTIEQIQSFKRVYERRYGCSKDEDFIEVLLRDITK